jgi:hypothetical protein
MEQTKQHDPSLISDLHGVGIASIDYLNERFFYLLWMRTRDEISTETADRWMTEFVSRAKEIHRLEIMDAYNDGHLNLGYNSAQDYYNNTFNAKRNENK